MDDNKEGAEGAGIETDANVLDDKRDTVQQPVPCLITHGERRTAQEIIVIASSVSRDDSPETFTISAGGDLPLLLLEGMEYIIKLKPAE